MHAGAGRTDILLNILPVCHVFGFVCSLLWGLSNGSCIALGRGPGTTSTTLFITNRPRYRWYLPCLASCNKNKLFNEELKTILIGGGDCDKGLLASLQNEGYTTAFGYGLTETSSGVAISTHGDLSAMDICPDDTITIGKDNEVLIESRTCMMKGYYKLHEETEEVLRENVLHTGDTGYIDEDGRLHITGRLKEILVLPNGTKIFLPEYEAELKEYLKSDEIAVTLKENKVVLVTSDEKHNHGICPQCAEDHPA